MVGKIFEGEMLIISILKPTREISFKYLVKQFLTFKSLSRVIKDPDNNFKSNSIALKA